MYQFVVKIVYLMIMVEQNDNQVHELLYDKKFQDDHQQHIDIDQYVLVVHEKPLMRHEEVTDFGIDNSQISQWIIY